MAYTKEQLTSLVTKNITVSGVMRDLGLHQTGGSHSHLSGLIRKFGIDTSHFKGSRANCGVNHKGGYQKKTPEQILILRGEDKPRTHGHRLRQALLEEGRPNKCEKCGRDPIWNGKPLVLTPDHKNGRFWDNRSSNLELLCPNCHSQTPTFCGRKNG